MSDSSDVTRETISPAREQALLPWQMGKSVPSRQSSKPAIGLHSNPAFYTLPLAAKELTGVAGIRAEAQEML